ncbi:hypothetical protein [Lysinibacillus sp. FSL K6-0102]|uniref:hypothetical protein n=1 Tax=Lysinibacillus sp. FSL K6-0102 TaxID=2975290 RepID=UPI0028F0DEA6|nr:hypothetical protein [uncultured Lysinibacillus sp.]
MKSVDEYRQLHFVDCFNRTHNTLVIGKMGKGAAFHMVKINNSMFCVSGEMGTGCRELQLLLPAPNNQNNLFSRVVTFKEQMEMILQNHQKKLRHNHYSAERELYRNIFGLMW